MDFNLIKRLQQPVQSKIVMLVMDGLGGLPKAQGRGTELETAQTPHLDILAAQSLCGLQQPVATGITPGSGPAHLALFGYDPLQFEVGRGVLAALGIGFDLKTKDVAARGNFCTLDDQGRVADRRAGRIAHETGVQLCRRLAEIKLAGVELFVEPVKDYRFLLVLRGDHLHGEIQDSDPQKIGVAPLTPEPREERAKLTAGLVQRFLEEAREKLAPEDAADMVLLRGFSQKPRWPAMQEIFGLRAAALAGYPMYRGLGRLIGMDPLESGESLEEQVESLENNWAAYDFFYLHAKGIDSAGEDGDFERKTALIEAVDPLLPRILALKPDVLIVTGDHSTPATLKSHSWHPVPVILHSDRCRPDGVERFGESACLAGGLGPRFPAQDLMPLALANAGRLGKFGA
ncbi:MAG: 2,3-bisphosphoglycerate-independent phosphoglycerate mutase [Desulfobacterales bacterium]